MVGGPFAKQLEDFAAKVEKRADICVGEVVTSIVARIDERSPVGNPDLWLHNKGTKERPEYVHWLAYNEPNGYVGGRFRANWQLGVGAKPEGVLDKADPGGEGTVSVNLGKIPEDAAGNVYYLVNNLPYAQALENGWSTQAPSGMVSLTLAETDGIVQDAVASAKRQAP